MRQGCEKRRRGRVVIPQIMVNKLKPPGDFSGLGMKGDHRIGPLVVAGTQSAIIVRAGAAGGNEDKVPLRIDSHNGPGVCSTAFPRLSRGGTAGRVRRNGIPTPAQSAGSRVESSHHAGWHIDTAVIVDYRSHDDNVVDHGRW